MTHDTTLPLVLVVDDEEHLCWVLNKVLSEAGYRVQTAQNGRAALQTCTAETVSVAIIDYRLPDMNGIELLQYLNRIQNKLASILISSYGSPHLCQEAVAVGFLAYFDKPLLHTKLLKCLATITAARPLP